MKRIGILTAGGDTPALNATIHGAVVRANQLRIEIFGFIKGFNCLFNPRVPHVHLNPLFQEIPELDPTKGGTLIGSSRDYVDPDEKDELDLIASRLTKLGIEGLICIGGDGTLNGMQPLSERLPTVLAPKTIDNDLGLNYPNEPDEWVRVKDPRQHAGLSATSATPSNAVFDLEQMVNYVTPGYATAVFVSARRRAHPHHGRKPSPHRHHRSDGAALRLHRARHRLRAARHHPDSRTSRSTSNCSSSGSKTSTTCRRTSSSCAARASSMRTASNWAPKSTSTDPAGNMVLSGAAEALRGEDHRTARRPLLSALSPRRSAAEAIFTRKVGHTQRGGRPILFDRFYAAQLGGKAVDLLVEGRNNAVSVLQYNTHKGFHVDGFDANRFRDRWGLIHARQMHPSLYDPHLMKPSKMGIEYLLPIFTDAIGNDDVEHMRQTLFDPGNLAQPYHSINTDVHKRIRYLEPGGD